MTKIGYAVKGVADLCLSNFVWPYVGMSPEPLESERRDVWARLSEHDTQAEDPCRKSHGDDMVHSDTGRERVRWGLGRERGRPR